jgi:hypothetical protein
MTLKLLGLLAVSAAVLSLSPGLAQNPDAPLPGRTHAASYAPVPSGLAITVRPWDNNTANLRLKGKFTEALSQRGIPLAETGAPLTLNFETEVESIAVPAGGPTLGQVQARNHDSRVRLNFWSTTQVSVVTGRRSGEVSTSSVRYVLRATLDDQRNGQRLWQGQTTYDFTSGDETTTFALMVPVLVDGLGQTVRPRNFRVE